MFEEGPFCLSCIEEVGLCRRSYVCQGVGNVQSDQDMFARRCGHVQEEMAIGC